MTSVTILLPTGRIVSGDVYEKDLGEKTDSIVKSMKTFDPGEGWNKVDLKSIKD